MELPYFPYHFTIQFTFLPYFPYHFTIHLAFLPYCSYHFTFQLTFLPYFPYRFTHHFWTYASNLTTVIRSVLKFMMNFPNMCSNIPAYPAYGAYISQLIRYARAGSNYSDLLKRYFHLRNRLLDQGYEKIRLIRSLKKFIFRYQDLVGLNPISKRQTSRFQYGSKFRLSL
jgi:hypothetical protein